MQSTCKLNTMINATRKMERRKHMHTTINGLCHMFAYAYNREAIQWQHRCTYKEPYRTDTYVQPSHVGFCDCCGQPSLPATTQDAEDTQLQLIYSFCSLQL